MTALSEHGRGGRFHRKTNFQYAPTPYSTNISPVSYDSKPVKTAGYVKFGQVDFTVTNKDSILDLDISLVNDNSHIWVTFDGPSWTVLRANTVYDLKITNVTSNDDNEVTFDFDKAHMLKVDDMFGITTIVGLNKFWKVKAATTTSITVQHTETFDAADGYDPSTATNPMLLTTARFGSYESMNPEHVALLTNGSKVFVDSNVNGRWEVAEKTKQFTPFKNLDQFLQTFEVLAQSADLRVPWV